MSVCVRCYRGNPTEGILPRDSDSLGFLPRESIPRESYRGILGILPRESYRGILGILPRDPYRGIPIPSDSYRGIPHALSFAEGSMNFFTHIKFIFSIAPCQKIISPLPRRRIDFLTRSKHPIKTPDRNTRSKRIKKSLTRNPCEGLKT